MKLFYDFFPLLLFFGAFKIYDIYVATAVAIAASFVQVGIHWLRLRKFETIHLVTLGVLVVFGGLTIILHDDTFIKWKPTIATLVLGTLILGSQFIGKKTAVERLFGSQMELPRAAWIKLNLSLALFQYVIAGLNYYVAFYYGLDMDEEARQAFWVNFKVFGITGLTVLYAVIMAFMLAKHLPDDTQKDDS